MTRRLFLAGAASPILALARRQPGESVQDAVFRPLFNGHDLTGWSGDLRLWEVRDGTIVGSTDRVRIEHNSFLSTDESFSDFVLRVSVRLRNHNSGIQFRSRRLADHVVAGYQADVAERDYFGMLYEEGGRGFMDYWEELSPAGKAAVFSAARPGDWNHYEVTCRGDRIRLVLNGVVTCDIRDPEGAREGTIALQLHRGEPMQVAFREILVRPL